MKTSGTSSGTEKINGKKVTYTRKITMPTEYDPKDTWDQNMSQETIMKPKQVHSQASSNITT